MRVCLREKRRSNNNRNNNNKQTKQEREKINKQINNNIDFEVNIRNFLFLTNTNTQVTAVA